MNKYSWLAIVGFLLWIAETAFFGFNEKPINGWEAIADVLSYGLIFWGVGGDILSGVTFKKTINIRRASNVYIMKSEDVNTIEGQK